MKQEVKTKVTTKHVLFMFIIQIVLSIVFTIATLFAPDSNLFILLNFGFAQLAVALAMLIIVKIKKIDFWDAAPLKNRKVSWPILALMPVVAIGLLLQNTLLMTGFDALMLKFELAADVPVPNVAENPAILIGALFFIGILPPIVEEIYFRGMIMSALKPRGMTYAIIVSSLVFSLSHQNAAQLVHQFIGGLVVAYIVAKTDNLLYGIVIHITNNIIAVLLLLSDWWANLSLMSTPSIITMVIMMVAGIGILVGCYFAFKKFREIEAKKLEAEAKETLQPELTSQTENSNLCTTAKYQLEDIYAENQYGPIAQDASQTESTSQVEDKDLVATTEAQAEVMDAETQVNETQTKVKPVGKFRTFLRKIDIPILAICLYCVISIILNLVVATSIKDMPLDFFDEPLQ
ncbi:MAG TPA: type II CAAX endopeptidase family protein [Clostridia bacterium]|jgi:membrane protease YdiL (CAAX protease family)|nr:type II CAAX endopeptidase family protein [Clostridia bacterium]